MRSWRLSLLIFEILLFALILVLPQVDLPDFTFHGGTAPVVAKAKSSSPPAFVTVAPVVPEFLRPVRPLQIDPIGSLSHTRTKSVLSLHCVLLC
jgi:hypothetical protein